MNDKQKEIVQKTADYVKDELYGEGSGHDWWHIYRVWKNAIAISEKEEGADMFIVQLASLLHDIADWKLHDGDMEIGPQLARIWLERYKVDPEVVDHVSDIVREISFKGANVKTKITTLEGKIVQDADRLDAIGAIGIGRTFTYGGSKSRVMYDPNTKPTLHESFDAYKKSASPTINHFYEKLFLLKDLISVISGLDCQQAPSGEKKAVMLEPTAVFSCQCDLNNVNIAI